MRLFSTNRRGVRATITAFSLFFSAISLAAIDTSPPDMAPAGVIESAAQASESITAKVAKGVQLRRERRDHEALALFREAFSVEPSARLLAQIALAEQAIGDWVQAEHDLVEALNDSSAWIVSHRDDLQASLASVREHLGFVLVTVNVSDAQFALNGRPQGRITPAPIRVPVGAIMVVVEAPGYYPEVRSSFVVPGATEHLAFTLDARVNGSHLQPPLMDAQKHAPARLVRAQGEPPSHTRHATRAHSFRAIAWSLVAASGALLTGAIVAHIASENLASEYNDDARCVRGDLTREQRCGTVHKSAHIGRTLAVLGYEAALGTGVVAGVLFERAGSLTPAEHPAARGLSVAVKGTW